MQAAYVALTFLTALPVPVPKVLVQRYWHGEAWSPSAFAKAGAYYPLAGYLVGGGAALMLWLAAPLPSAVAAALALVVWLGLTGWLHFDGLVDSADALLASCSPQRRLDIMRDVHLGAFGLGVGGVYLLLLHSLLAAGLPWYAPVTAAVWARALVLLPMQLFPSARGISARGISARAITHAQTPRASLGAQAAAQSEGTEGTQAGHGRTLLGLLLAAPTLLWPLAWAGALAAGAAMLLLAWWAARRLGGGLTGDVYGLLIVSGEVAALLAVVALLT